MTVYAIDAETDPFDGSTDIAPFIWDIFDGVNHFTCETVAECHAFIADHKGLYYAHNGGKFDFHLCGFTDAIEDCEDILAINGRLVRFHMLGSEFRDSYAILPSPLRALGGKGEIDYAKMLRKVRHKFMGEILAYLHQDTKVLWEAVTAFRAQYGTGLTLAGAAIKELEARLPKGKKLPKLRKVTDAKIRRFYYGGRVEAHIKGVINTPFKVFDIASAYPMAMTVAHAWGETCDIDHAVEVDAPIDPHAFYDVTAVSRGALPAKGKDGSLSFPVSEYRNEFTVTGWELLAGIETRTVDLINIHERITFAEVCDFKKYVSHFYRLKADAPKGSHERLFAKLLLNSAYGKLGSNPDKYTRQLIVSDEYRAVYESEDMGWTCSGSLGKRWIVERPLEDFEKKRLHVGAAASITGWVRAFLWREMCRIREAGGTVLYNDTDSIACANADVACGEKLGDWTLDANCLRGGIGGKKLYAFETDSPKPDEKWKISCKGARLTAAQIMKVAAGESVLYKSEAPSFSLKRAPTIMQRTIKRT